jgi:hypothetical protein
MEDFIFTGEDLLNSILCVNENKTSDKSSKNLPIREYSLGILRGNGKQRIEAVSKRLAHTLFTLSANEACLSLLSEEFKKTNEFQKPMDFFEKYITTDSFPSQGDKVILKLPITEFSIRNRSIAFIIYMLTSFYHINKLHEYISPIYRSSSGDVLKIKNQQLYDRYIDDLLLSTILSTLNFIVDCNGDEKGDYRDEIAKIYNDNLDIYKKLLSSSEENINSQILISIDKEYKSNNLFESKIMYNQENDAVKTLKLSSIFSNLSQIEIENILYIIKFLFIGKLLDEENDTALKSIFATTKISVINRQHTIESMININYIVKEKFCDSLTNINNESLKLLENLSDSYSNPFYSDKSYSILKRNINSSLKEIKNYKPKYELLKKLINDIDTYISDFDNINLAGYTHTISLYNLNRLIPYIDQVLELQNEVKKKLNELKKIIPQLEFTKIPVQADNLIKKLKRYWDEYTNILNNFKIELDAIFLPLLALKSDNNIKNVILFDNEFSKVGVKDMPGYYENWDILKPTINMIAEAEKKYKETFKNYYKNKITKESRIKIYKRLINIEDYINQFHIVYYNKGIKTCYDTLIKTANLPYPDYINFLKSEIPNLKLK